MLHDTERADFEQAAGESFAETVCPPVPFDDASAHECWEAVQTALKGRPDAARFASLTDPEIDTLAAAFAHHFDCDPPGADQIRAAVATLLARWPAVP